MNELDQGIHVIKVGADIPDSEACVLFSLPVFCLKLMWVAVVKHCMKNILKPGMVACAWGPKAWEAKERVFKWVPHFKTSLSNTARPPSQITKQSGTVKHAYNLSIWEDEGELGECEAS